jgi:hypothetical protein
MFLRSRRGGLEVYEALTTFATIYLLVTPIVLMATVAFVIAGLDWAMLVILAVLYTIIFAPALIRRRLEIDRDYSRVRLRWALSVAAFLPALTLRRVDQFNVSEAERLEVLRVRLGRGFGYAVDLLRTTEETPSLAAAADLRVRLHLGYFFRERSAQRHAAAIAAAFDDLPIHP